MAGKDLVKKANVQTEFTPSQILELQKCSRDPIYYINNYVKIEHPIEGIVQFDLYDYEEEMIHNMQNNRFCINAASRQCGKTTTVGAYFLWFTSFNFQKVVLIVSNKMSSATEFIHRIRIMYQYLPDFIKPGVTSDGWNKTSVGFDNGSRILSRATSEDAARSLSLSVVFADEFAFVRDTIQKDFWSGLSPTLATGGSCFIASTPNGDTNLFAQLWRGAESEANGFKPLKVKWDRVPGRDEAWKESEIARIGLTRFKQEYEVEFISSDPLLISSLVLAQIKTSNEFKTVKGFKFWNEIESNKTYILGVDPSSGIGADFSVIEIFSFPDLVQVAEFRSNTDSSTFIYKAMKSMLKLIQSKKSKVYYSVENNGIGEGILSLIDNDENSPEEAEFISEEGSKRYGMTTTSKSKLKAAIQLKELIKNGGMKINSKNLLLELKNYARKKNTYEAKPGSTDDCVAATLIVIRILHEISIYEEAAFEKLYIIDDEDWFDTGIGGLYDENNPDHAPMPISF